MWCSGFRVAGLGFRIIRVGGLAIGGMWLRVEATSANCRQHHADQNQRNRL